MEKMHTDSSRTHIRRRRCWWRAKIEGGTDETPGFAEWLKRTVQLCQAPTILRLAIDRRLVEVSPSEEAAQLGPTLIPLVRHPQGKCPGKVFDGVVLFC